MKIIEILLVEDDALDVINVRRNLDKLDIQFRMSVCKNGEDALTYLKEKSKEDSLPDLILVDVNMPRMNGFELIDNIRKDKAMKQLKCFMITTSNQAIDKAMAKKLEVSGYIVKPIQLTNPKSIDSMNLMIDLLNF
ncbi:MAG: response regulator [Ginsengibacter sp.]